MRTKSVAKAGEIDKNVIIVHPGTSNVSRTSSEQLLKEDLETLLKMQENNKEPKIVFSSIFKRTDKDLNH